MAVRNLHLISFHPTDVLSRYFSSYLSLSRWHSVTYFFFLSSSILLEFRHIVCNLIFFYPPIEEFCHFVFLVLIFYPSAILSLSFSSSLRLFYWHSVKSFFFFFNLSYLHLVHVFSFLLSFCHFVTLSLLLFLPTLIQLSHFSSSLLPSRCHSDTLFFPLFFLPPSFIIVSVCQSFILFFLLFFSTTVLHSSAKLLCDTAPGLLFVQTQKLFRHCR
jgi:hypothetical protein